MSTFNYSKWDNIELSDDESDLHPNIDKESWFRMKHRARIEREEKEDHEIKELERRNDENSNRLKIIQARLNGLNNNKKDDNNDEEYEDVDALKAEAQELEGFVNTRNKRITEIKKKRAWNIDNICKVSEEKTIVNKNEAQSLKASEFAPTGITESNLAEREELKKASNSDDKEETSGTKPIVDNTTTSKSNTTVKASSDAVTSTTTSSTITKSKSAKAASKERLQVLSYNDYVLTYESTLENYSEIYDIEGTKDFLFKNCDVLLHEHAQSYMLLSCLEDEMNGKRERMKLVCRQSQILSHITELGVSMKRDPRDVVLPFFMRIQEKEYFAAFLSAINDFIQKIIERAVVKRKEMDKEREDENEEMQSNVPLGPGGLNPFEVLKQLPEVLRNAFESQDLQRLQDVLASMEPAEAKKWMKMCVDSGLWVPKDETLFEEDDEYEAAHSSDDIE